MNTDRFRSFTAGYKDSDLWIGVDPSSYSKDMKVFSGNLIKEYRIKLENYLLRDPRFADSLVPIELKHEAPEIARIMSEASQRTGIGPMSAVAGAFAECLGKELIKHFDPEEVVIENGGDIFLKMKDEILLSVFAGNSPLSGKVGIKLPKINKPVGVCTSAGKVGPSLSLGNTDAVMVVCESTPLADSWATLIGNLVKSAKDIEPVLKETDKYPDILSVLVICEGSLGVRGKFDLKIF